MRSSPPVPPRETERLAEELRRSASGEVSWSLGSANSRIVLSTLGYGLNMDSSRMADVVIAEVLQELGYPPDQEFSLLPNKDRNRVLKYVDKRIRTADREIENKLTRGTDDFLSHMHQSQVRSLDRAHKEMTLEQEGYRIGSGLSEVGKLAANTASRKFHNDGSGIHASGPDYGKRPGDGVVLPANVGRGGQDFGKSMHGTVGKLEEIHRQNRERGTVHPEYDADVEFVTKALMSGFGMEKPQGSSIHHLIEFMRKTPKHAVNADFLMMLENNFQSFVVEHNWASAFDKSEDFEGGEVNLPFDYTCFEFRVNGMRVLVPLGKTKNGDVVGCLVSGVNRNWYINQSSLLFSPQGVLVDQAIGPDEKKLEGFRAIEGFVDMLGRQIRAVCIMLDAKVARGDPVQPSAALNKQRKKQGKSILKPYHVVTLNRRHRGEHERGDGSGTHKRMHWRRGHWRHYQTPGGKVQYNDSQGILRSKNWIHWMLVGSPDLGFVDKHYRL